MDRTLCILLCFSSVFGNDPNVFQEYFDDSVREVDISQDSAIIACLQNGNALANKVNSAYDNCFGEDYDFNDLADNSNGPDSDNDGLPNSFEDNEACFYTEMGWVIGSQVQKNVIKNDLVGLDVTLKVDFDANVDSCADWNGDFSSRRKREVTGEEESAVPSIMDSKSQQFVGLQALVRNIRTPKKKCRGGQCTKPPKKKCRRGKCRSGKNKSKKKGKGKNKNKKTKTTKKPKKKRSGKKKKCRGGQCTKPPKKKCRRGKCRSGKNKSKKKGKGKNKNGKSKPTKKPKKKRSGKNKKRPKRPKRTTKPKKKRSGKKKSKKKGKGKKKKNKKPTTKPLESGIRNAGDASAGLDESTYNKMWCIDLAMEQILEKCVEEKIKN